MAGQGDEEIMGGVAFGTNRAFNGLVLIIKPSLWICNILWSFDRPYYVQILTKINCGKRGKHGKSEWHLSKQPGVPEMASFDGNQRTGWQLELCRFSWATENMFSSLNIQQGMKIPLWNGSCFILEACR